MVRGRRPRDKARYTIPLLFLQYSIIEDRCQPLIQPKNGKETVRNGWPEVDFSLFLCYTRDTERGRPTTVGIGGEGVVFYLISIKPGNHYRYDPTVRETTFI